MKRRGFLKFVSRGMVAAGYAAAFGLPSGQAAEKIAPAEVEGWINPDLADLIYEISPLDTPMMSNIKRPQDTEWITA